MSVRARVPGPARAVAALAAVTTVVALGGCSGNPTPAAHAPPAVAAALARTAPAVDAGSAVVTGSAAIESGETAWLVAHLADDPDPARGGESDAVRRLARRGPEGVRAVIEVFRVGDARREPFARRVIERVALQHCRHDRRLAARLVVGLQGGPDAGAIDADAGFIWSGGDDTRWSAEALGRASRWIDAGLPCDPAGGAEGGPDAALPPG